MNISKIIKKFVNICLAIALCYTAISASGPVYAEELVGESDIVTYGDFKLQMRSTTYQYEVVEYTGSSAYVSIPSYYYGSETIKISAIGDGFLKNNTTVTTVVLPDTINTIGSYAFSGCTKLSTISWAQKQGGGTVSAKYQMNPVVTIGDYAFYGCKALTSLDLSLPGVEYIGESAFEDCTGFTKVSLPRTLRYVGGNAFNNCMSIETMDFYGTIDDWMKITYGSDTPGTHPNYYAKENYLSTKTDTSGWGDNVYTLNKSSFTVEFKAGSGDISSYEFYNFKTLQAVKVNGSESIGNYAFGNCSALNSLEIHNTVRSVGTNIVSGCSSLGTVSVHQNSPADTVLLSQRNVNGCAYFHIEYMVEDGCGAAEGGDVDPTPDIGDIDPVVPPVIEDESVTVDNKCCVYGYSGLFDGSIGLKIYYKMFSEDSGAKLKVRIPDGNNGYSTQELSFSQAQKSGSIYTFTINVAPKEADSLIYSQVVLSDGKKGTENYISYYSYMVKIVGKNLDQESTLAKLILAYCDASQDYFDYHSGNIGESLYYDSSWMMRIDSTSFQNYSMSITDSDYIGMSLSFDGDISVNLYYKGDKDISTWNAYKEYKNGYTIYTFSGFKFNGDSLGKVWYYTDSKGTTNYFKGVYSYFNAAYSMNDSELNYLFRVVYTIDSYFSSFNVSESNIMIY